MPDLYYVPETDPYSLKSAERGDVLFGNPPEIWLFSRWLNADPPRDLHDLRNRVQQMIMVARPGAFKIGPALRGET